MYTVVQAKWERNSLNDRTKVKNHIIPEGASSVHSCLHSASEFLDLS